MAGSLRAIATRYFLSLVFILLSISKILNTEHLKGMDQIFFIIIINFTYYRKRPDALYYQPDGKGRDQYILTNHGGFIDRYWDTGDYDSLFGNSLRKHRPIIMKNSAEVSKSPIMSPKAYLSNVKTTLAFGGSPRKNPSPRKNFQTNQFQNG